MHRQPGMGIGESSVHKSTNEVVGQSHCGSCDAGRHRGPSSCIPWLECAPHCYTTVVTPLGEGGQLVVDSWCRNFNARRLPFNPVAVGVSVRSSGLARLAGVPAPGHRTAGVLRGLACRLPAPDRRKVQVSACVRASGIGSGGRFTAFRIRRSGWRLPGATRPKCPRLGVSQHWGPWLDHWAPGGSMICRNEEGWLLRPHRSGYSISIDQRFKHSNEEARGREHECRSHKLSQLLRWTRVGISRGFVLSRLRWAKLHRK